MFDIMIMDVVVLLECVVEYDYGYCYFGIVLVLISVV